MRLFPGIGSEDFLTVEDGHDGAATGLDVCAPVLFLPVHEDDGESDRAAVAFDFFDGLNGGTARGNRVINDDDGIAQVSKDPTRGGGGGGTKTTWTADDPAVSTGFVRARREGAAADIVQSGSGSGRRRDQTAGQGVGRRGLAG